MGDRREARLQTADAVMLLRPHAFGWNPETVATNRFQSADAPAGDDIAARAVEEFDAAVRVLRDAGIECHVFADLADRHCADAVFPNNWLSLHSDGTAVLYPMLAPARRRERRMDLLEQLRGDGSFLFTRLIDLTHHELHGRFLEGTGSVVFDHVDRVAYACRSARTHPVVLEDLCAQLGYRPHLYAAVDADGIPVYHTNVIQMVGERFALLCAEAIAETDRQSILDSLAASGRRVLRITFTQAREFAGNMLELRAASGAQILVMSARARAALGEELFGALSAAVDRIVPVDVRTFEEFGGGSIRCMLAEVFLPRAR